MEAGFKWYRAAAEQGLAVAQLKLGVMYAKGEGTPQDYRSVHIWWNLASASGEEDAKNNRDKVAGIMTPADISAAQQMAREWMEQHP
jgi:TPR repeat protein